MDKKDEAVLVVAMKSPGGKQYQFSVRKTQRNMNLFKSEREMAIHLEELKRQGLRPQENPKGTITSQIANSTQKDQGEDAAAADGRVESCEIVCESDDVPIDYCEVEDEVDAVSDADGSKRNIQENQSGVPESKRGKFSAKNIAPKTVAAKVIAASAKKPKDLEVRHCVKGEKMIYEVERVLLEEVLKKPALFDFRLDFKERTPDLLFKLRMDIANMLNEAFSIILPTEVVENTFNYYRALYVQFSNATKALPSGSGSNRMPKEPKHFEVLKQLDFLYERREQFSSTTAAGFQLKPPQGRGKGKGKTFSAGSDDVDHLFDSANHLITSLQKQNSAPTPSTHAPSSKEDVINDHHHAFFYNILPDFKKLNPPKTREFKIRVSKMLNDFIKRYDDEDDTTMRSNVGSSFLNGSEDHHVAFFNTILPDFRKLKRTHKREFKIMVMDSLNDVLKIDEDLENNTFNVNDSTGSQVNISDVIDVIRTTDPSAQEMFNSGSGSANNPDQLGNTQTNSAAMNSRSGHRSPRSHSTAHLNAYVEIIEQPAPKALRFRYPCEGRSAGSIPGENSTSDNKTFPAIRVVNYTGPAVVVVSCVTKDQPYRVHPHKLVGKDGCKKGVYTLGVNNESMTATFANLGIQCVKKKDIEESLKEREEIKVDPFRKGYGHASQPSSIDLNAVRLCFQVFLKNERDQIIRVLTPVVSSPIYDKKAMSDLVICKLSKPSSSVAGGEEIILLCEKVAKEDIQVRFYEEKQGSIVWEGTGDFQHSNVHKQVAISFRTPPYKFLDIKEPVKCRIQLRRPSDNATSEPLPFDYLPLDSDKIELKRKRLRTTNEPFSHDNSLQLMVQQNLYLPDAVKQEPISPRYVDLASPSGQQRYTPSPNQLPSTAMSLNIPVQQQRYDMVQQYPPTLSPMNANMLNLQYQTQSNNQTHSNIPNASTFNEAANFLNNNSHSTQPTEQRNIEDIFLNNNLDNMNQLDNVTNTNQDANLDTSGMNISSLLNLDGQHINSSMLSNDLSDIFRNLENRPMVGENQEIIPIMIDAMQTNQPPPEENMTDSFKNISIE